MWNQCCRKARFYPSISLHPHGTAAHCLCSWQSISLSVFLVQPEVKVSISQFMSYVHMSVKEMSKTYLAMERRYNYTTPKTFLEQINLYKNLLSKKRSELTAKIERLEKGLTKLQSTASQVPAHSITYASCLLGVQRAVGDEGRPVPTGLSQWPRGPQAIPSHRCKARQGLAGSTL